MDLKLARKSSNMTQKEFAEKLGVKRTTVSMWESGKTMPPSKKLLALSQVLGVTVDELLMDKDATGNDTLIKPSATWYCVATLIYDDGAVVAQLMDEETATEKPRDSFTQMEDGELRKEWFPSKAAALAHVAACQKEQGQAPKHTA